MGSPKRRFRPSEREGVDEYVLAADIRFKFGRQGEETFMCRLHQPKCKFNDIMRMKLWTKDVGRGKDQASVDFVLLPEIPNFN